MIKMTVRGTMVYSDVCYTQGPTGTRYPTRTRNIFNTRSVLEVGGLFVQRSCLLNDPISPEKNNRDHIPEQENKFHFEGVNGGGSNPVFHFFIFILAKKQKRFPFEGVGGSVKSETCSLFLIFILLLWFWENTTYQIVQKQGKALQFFHYWNGVLPSIWGFRSIDNIWDNLLHVFKIWESKQKRFYLVLWLMIDHYGDKRVW